MNNDFPRILTLLRKERGISQKQAASELNISQALLSHYEKGIRECGLDFVVKTANFYNVSCDYLLGRSPERTGATLSVSDIPEDDSFNEELKDNNITLNKRIISNSLNIVFDLLNKTKNSVLIKESSDYLMLGVYNIFRILYDINPKNESSLFTVNKHTFSTVSTSKMLDAQAKMIETIQKKDNDIDIEQMAISSNIIENDYPNSSSSIFNLIRSTENKIK